MKKALVVIDMQNDFISGALGSAEARKIVPSVAKIINDMRSQGYEVFFTRDAHDDNYLNSYEGKKLPVKHCVKGTDGWNICDGVKAAAKDGDIIIDKPTFGSLELARSLCGYDEVVLCGVCTDICVISNAVLIKTMSPDTSVYVAKSCVAGTTKNANDAALITMQSLQIDIL